MQLAVELKCVNGSAFELKYFVSVLVIFVLSFLVRFLSFFNVVQFHVLAMTFLFSVQSINLSSFK